MITLNSNIKETSVCDLDLFPGGVCLVSMTGDEKLLAVNKRLLTFYGCSSEEEFMAYTGGTYRGMVEPADYIPLKQLYERRSGDRERDVPGYNHFRIRTKEGHFLDLDGLISTVSHPKYGHLWTLHMVRTRIRLESEEMDRITGLLGRYAFYKRVGEMAAQDIYNGIFGSRVPVYINFTNFKLYNANHGIAVGDDFLRKIAYSLRTYFSDSLIAHLSADNFAILAPKENIRERLESLAEDLKTQVEDHSIVLKAGIMDSVELLGNDAVTNPRRAFDLAKMAADSIKQDASRTCAVYTEDMGQKLADQAYVLRNLEKALANGWVKVYFQPVVRTLTGKLCSMEALARWVDPERGLLTPNLFIPVLEKARLIPKLDIYIINRVASLLRCDIDNGLPVVPVSVNLSRVDFERIDPFKYIENIVKRYHLSRDLFCIELTETELALDGEKLQEEMGRFRKAGYRCWLDDFGSGYSSLNVLQNFHFDEMKLDMAFQRNTNADSRQILRSLCLMARSLGIHTLAEGVETKEQMEYLREIGCEKIQGYYYGKPMAYAEVRDYCREHHLVPEMPEEACVLDKVGLVNTVTDMPVALFSYDGENLVNLFENKAFRSVVKTISPQRRHWDGEPLRLDDHPVIAKIKERIEWSAAHGREETMNYVDNGRYMRGTVKVLAKEGNLCTGRMELYNITDNDNSQSSHKMDAAFRNILIVFRGIYCYRAKEDKLEILETASPWLKVGAKFPYSILTDGPAWIHKDDRERFKKYVDRDVLRRKTGKEKQPAIGLFRLRLPNGGYRWQEVIAFAVSPEPDSDILFCVKNVSLESVVHEAGIRGEGGWKS